MLFSPASAPRHRPSFHVRYGASKSAASRRFVAQTKRQLEQWQRSDLSGLDLMVVMLDGIVIAGRAVIVALGIDGAGKKHPLGLWLGATENATVCGALLDDLIERGLDAQRAYLFVVDGSKALRKAIRTRFGSRSLVQRCQEHKRRNVIGHLPKDLHRSIRRSMQDAYRGKTRATAKKRLLQIASHLQSDHPDAASSLREGLDETLTIKAMRLPLALEKTLSTTNSIENLNSFIRRQTRNVHRWRNGAMIKRWVSAALIEAQKGFHRLRGHKGMPLVAKALRANAERIDRIDSEQEAA